MILKTTTNEFCFINVSFYETIADPRYFFEQDYEEMPEYEEELDFDFDSYCNKFIPLFVVFRFCNNRDAYTGRFGAFIQRHLHGKGRRIISSCPG